ncbi:MAG: hypothetical protein V1862_02600 [Methanobacteriota archaeon]
MKIIIVTSIIGLILLLFPGILAESLISFDQEIKPDLYATGELISRAGTINIPAGMGIITATAIIQPYWSPKDGFLPVQIVFSPVNPGELNPYPEEIGIEVFQFGNEVKGLSFSNGVPLKLVTRYFVNNTQSVPYYIILHNAADKGNMIHDYNLAYSAEYESLNINQSAYLNGDPTGEWNTNIGPVNLTYIPEHNELQKSVKGIFSNGNTIEGVLEGPVWFGEWSTNMSLIEIAPSELKAGQFMAIFDKNWSSFIGTKGKIHSYTNNGSFTGEKITS